MTLTTSLQLRVGDPAPDFTLPSTSNTIVTLSAFRPASNVLIAFFPLAFTGVCTAEMCEFSHDFAQFERLNATVLGVSVDSVPTLKEFKARHGITVELLSDFKREVSRAYGVLLEEPFFARRSYFIVDRAGQIAWMHIEDEIGHKRDNRELLEQLARL